MNRNFDWAERLDDVIREAKDKPFVWGEHDCTIFVSACIKAMTGEDLAKGVVGKYSTPAGAKKFLKKKENVDDLFALADKKLGHSYQAWLARRGDVVGYIEDGQEALGIAVIGKGVFLTPDGNLTFKRLGDCERCWRV